MSDKSIQISTIYIYYGFKGKIHAYYLVLWKKKGSNDNGFSLPSAIRHMACKLDRNFHRQ